MERLHRLEWFALTSAAVVPIPAAAQPHSFRARRR